MQKYNGVSIFFHWLIAVLIIGLLAVGLIMVDMPKPDKFTVYGWHKAFGIIVLALVTLRLIWRLRHAPPSLPVGTPPRIELAAKLGHAALYFLMFFMPLVGWLMSSAGGHPVSVFGLPIPPLVEKNEALGELAEELHEIGGNAFIVLICLHLLAALYHQYVLKDGLLQRMLPGK